jgi:enterochelin esterase-like enzyme
VNDRKKRDNATLAVFPHTDFCAAQQFAEISTVFEARYRVRLEVRVRLSGPHVQPDRVRQQMRRSFAVLSMLVAFAAGSGSGRAVASEIVRQDFASASMTRELGYLVYLPDGYRENSRRYPVLYLLHGSGDDENNWLKSVNVKQHVDQLIAQGAIPPAIVVMPGCKGSWWIDAPRAHAETAFWKELVPAIDTQYRTLDDKGRLIAGVSMGGYGAIRFAMKYPNRVTAVAAFSPAIYSVSPPKTSAARLDPAFLDTKGAFDQARWTAENYPNLIGQYFGQPTRVPFYLVSGDGDKLGLAFETALLFKTLFEEQPSYAELRIVDGTHDWGVWNTTMDDALKYLFRFIPRNHAALSTR